MAVAKDRRKPSSEPKRFGGELPLGCDPLLEQPSPLPPNVLCFSHGRAALSWLLESRGPFRSAAMCAYTCPTVPRHLAGRGLKIGFFDYGDPEPAALVRGLPGRCLLLVPAPFGMEPWLDLAALARDLDEKGMVVLDAAQAAFGHLEFPVPPGGAVLSVPRKAIAIGDGAILALGAVADGEAESVVSLPSAAEPSRMKQAGRALFAASDPSREAEALDLVERAEALWPATPHRMSEHSLAVFRRIDPAVHGTRRRQNAHRLAARLGDRLPSLLKGEGTPFTYPVLVDERDALLKLLHARRVFATPLWSDARHDPIEHPVAGDLTRRLLALPVDQRYAPADMDELAQTVLSCL